MKQNRYGAVGFIVALLLVTSMAGCGGGGGAAAPGGTPVVSSGTVTAIGSVVVNGIRFEDTAANITGDDTAKVLADVRKIGATLKIRGRVNDDGLTGVAERIEIENELRGAVTAKGPDSLIVLGQTVFVDGGTLFANVADFATIAIGDNVEVHGARDAAGAVRATRIERLGAGIVDELRGTISAKTGTTTGTVTIGGAVFNYDPSSVVVPAGAAFDVGTLVEIHLNGATITRLEVEDLDEAEFEPGEGQETEAEGFITGFTAHPGTFLVAGREVRTTSSTRILGGLPADLANNVKVEAEGPIVAGVLVADKITFKDAIRIESNVVSVGAGSIVLLGKTVQITSNTIGGGTLLLAGDGVRIRGFLNLDNASITATRIDLLSNPVAANQNRVQSLVSSFNATTRHLSLLGLDVDASGNGVEFQNENDLVITGAQFFGQLVAGTSVVQARGTVSGSTLLANQVEIE